MNMYLHVKFHSPIKFYLYTISFAQCYKMSKLVQPHSSILFKNSNKSKSLFALNNYVSPSRGYLFCPPPLPHQCFGSWLGQAQNQFYERIKIWWSNIIFLHTLQFDSIWWVKNLYKIFIVAVVPLSCKQRILVKL